MKNSGTNGKPDDNRDSKCERGTPWGNWCRGHLGYDKEQRNGAVAGGRWKVKGMCLLLFFSMEETKKYPGCYRVWGKRLITQTGTFQKNLLEETILELGLTRIVLRRKVWGWVITMEGPA